jgi:hypothetical protein
VLVFDDLAQRLTVGAVELVPGGRLVQLLAVGRPLRRSKAATRALSSLGLNGFVT